MSKKLWVIGGAVVALLAALIAVMAFITTSQAIEEVQD